MNEPVKRLKEYFEKREDVLMAFVFGSQAEKKAAKISDWDIAVYFKPLSPNHIEWEDDREYPQESKVWADLVEVLDTDDVDLVILNRAPAYTSASALQGLPLVIKDRRVYLEFMLIITREAEDYIRDSEDYAKIYWRSLSLSEPDKNVLSRRLIFLDSELKDADKFQTLSLGEYESDSMKRREVERWIENLMNAALDIAKIILASERRPIPSTYREVLRSIGTLPGLSKDLGDELSRWVELRNILAPECLDIRWKRIEDFLKRSEPHLRKLIEVVRGKFI